ncbi:6-phosphogluconate dehydrogenase, decarboxylating [Pseudonocardia sp. Ae168_Ps1]|uniref:NADP-dependent phosphogluconate dehydrogenase n=1 Tax=unclassified Pseudonocardia TaxID=2619320 RepID=UPI0001FFEEE8|nr:MULTISPECIES: NADP-dependent phosphogluconate dehydrogenase [unclassified Pseudonocardia]ALE74624.1 6-phosphogluconate dehydrogenase [Pseudonocardia sp. EC080625-04]ALL78051.1 6-phosphogluconate dehydrogenase [Pseudonocardia sp. EC080610-09]ALL80962.1 6-phosphogluconate dehydrogenase [Pseudonocardia sp. EC080619-01]OLL76259.1 6-phosphogluconate dehydrogenase, decarboxylating [Pseudonocardia sp. Ae150A_Ps1]OLL82258.1 6-phosphogluconate dehydrogenase, decarboxylating [Pseudonocardia sp. Ae168
MAEKSRIGVTGLAVMGANLARNMARRGFGVAVHNRTTSKTTEFMKDYGHEGSFTGAESLQEFVDALETPRKIVVMVKAGKPVDAVIDELAPLLDSGDIIIDAGNSHFPDTDRRAAYCAERGLRFMGIGVSGGEEGALNGPSIMPGGPVEAYGEVSEILTAIAAEVDGTPCCTHVGPGGAGHYVKMVHNGIEYADIQLIAEAYDLLSHVGGLSAPEIGKIVEQWNTGDLESFLIEITGIVLAKTDEKTGTPLVDVITDQAEQKGTGRWTAIDALDLGVPLTGITEAVFARTLSALRDERKAASTTLAGPAQQRTANVDQLVEDVRQALYASKVVAYAQGFAQMRAASQANGWDLDLGAMARIWRGGCIIRAQFLNRITEAYETHPDLDNLLMVPYFTEAVGAAQDAWRRVVVTATENGVAIPAFSSSLSYYDGYRRERGPANLIQGLRDYFGAHTYERIDADGKFHTRWSQDGAEVRTD